ncbi:hypothetical protein ACLOJK_012261 [Asimina triloba]
MKRRHTDARVQFWHTYPKTRLQSARKGICAGRRRGYFNSSGWDGQLQTTTEEDMRLCHWEWEQWVEHKQLFSHQTTTAISVLRRTKIISKENLLGP